MKYGKFEIPEVRIEGLKLQFVHALGPDQGMSHGAFTAMITKDIHISCQLIRLDGGGLYSWLKHCEEGETFTLTESGDEEYRLYRDSDWNYFHWRKDA